MGTLDLRLESVWITKTSPVSLTL